MALRRLLKTISKFTVLDFEYMEKTHALSEKLREELERKGLEYERYTYPVAAPSWSWYLRADGKEVRSLPFGLSSGEYEGPPKVVKVGLDEAPPEGSIAYVDGSVSEIRTPTFSSGPALAVSPRDAESVSKAKRVEWALRVRTVETFGFTYLIGDLDSAERAIITHYDSLWSGSVDNASGTTLALEMLDLVDLKKNVFVFVGFAEINMKEEEYWLPSFKSVVGAYAELFERVKEVVVVDCVGTGAAGWIKDKEYVEAYSPFGVERLRVYGTPLKDMQDYYHGTNDTPDKVLGNALVSDLRTLVRYLAQG